MTNTTDTKGLLTKKFKTQKELHAAAKEAGIRSYTVRRTGARFTIFLVNPAR